jgi:anaerobic magnesium-protoporphyrin IX monomethyl ester cyclase
MIDLLVLSMPIVDTNGPTAGIYYIKSSAEQAGFVSVAKDLNLWFQSQDVDIFAINNYFAKSNLDLLDETCQEHTTTVELFKTYIDDNYKFFESSLNIGISLFSVYNIFPGIIFAEIIRKKFPSKKIIVGGNGTEDTAIDGGDIGEYFLTNKLADYAVYGEGEEAIQYILQGKEHPSVNSKKMKRSINDLNKISYPNYEDFFIDFPHYKEKHNLFLPILGSRGCVRNCTFCNVNEIWPTYRFRSGKHIAQEMIENNEKYNVSNYRFGDSLVNGSLKAFRDMCNELAIYNQNTSRPVQWTGQFICRSKKQMPYRDFVTMRQSGCVSVSIGIESGSEKVRNEIKKGFSEEDMIYTIDSCLSNNIEVTLMFLVGYPTETDKDFEDSINLLKYYADKSSMIHVKVGKTLRLLDHTPLTTNFSHLYYYDDNKYSEWTSTVVPDLTFEKRAERAFRLGKIGEQLGYKMMNVMEDEHFLNNKILQRGKK